jgi:hypothetical protein
MATTYQCIHLAWEKCKILSTSYQKVQEERLSSLLASTGEQLVQLSSVTAAYDLASCSIQRLTDIITDCYSERPSEEQALRQVLDGLTHELLFLGGAMAQTRGRGPFVQKASPGLRSYHQGQAKTLRAILFDIEEMLVPVLTCYITSFMDEEQIQTLDAEPYWSDTTRRKCIAEICQKLSSEGKLDEAYALIAQDVLKVEYPRDIHSEGDRYRRCALPTLVRRLLVRDLITFIAGLRVECADRDVSFLAFGGSHSAMESLLERRASTIPVPERSLHMKVFRDTLPLLERVSLAAVHPEPCLLCQTYGDHCGMWQVTFPEGTTFGEATQTEYDQLQHSYTFSPTLPGGLPDGWCIFLSYSGIWEPDCPWTLTVLDLSEELVNKEKREG